MTKLWEKGYTLNNVVEQFMTGDDPLLDLRIAKYDCIASIAHAKMLTKIGIITDDEFHSLVTCLDSILQQIKANKFIISSEDEDVHTTIENYLTQHLGDTGKKIHTARSRNDQVLTALRLYCRDQILLTLKKLVNTLNVFHEFAIRYQNVPYVGRTHYQKAMPASIGLWMGAFIESLLDDGELLITSYNLVNQSPLGSAASYGVALPIDRQYSSDLLGFKSVQNNVLYANNSRGKFESIVIHGFSQIMLDLSKLSTDVILFAAPEMGYLELPNEFCPGSSLMPNKKNPDPFELIRAKSATIIANLLQTLEISRALPSGYNRDFQETKRTFFEACDIVTGSLDVVAIIMAKVTVNKEACIAGFNADVFATDATLNLVNNGMPFRDAYLQIAQQLNTKQHPAMEIDQPNINDPLQNILAKTHMGATGNLGLDIAKQRILRLQDFINSTN
ncbi:MAG TPA: argininosuccinate lyase [Aquella sp.]|nr:argininosuccinate lyase [Aquella sp.]